MGQCSSKRAIEGISDAKGLRDERDASSKSASSVAPALAGDQRTAKVLVYVLGGPGCGKGTQCARMTELYGFEHISSGDLLRAEVDSGSEAAERLRADMSDGRLVADGFILELLRKAINASSAPVVLLDGFPRSIEQAKLADTILTAAAVLFFDCSRDIMKERILSRAQTSGRSDDNEDTISKRLETFDLESAVVKQHYADQGNLHVVSAEQDTDAVFNDVRTVVDAMQIRQVDNQTAAAPEDAELLEKPSDVPESEAYNENSAGDSAQQESSVHAGSRASAAGSIASGSRSLANPPVAEQTSRSVDGAEEPRWFRKTIDDLRSQDHPVESEDEQPASVQASLQADAVPPESQPQDTTPKVESDPLDEDTRQEVPADEAPDVSNKPATKSLKKPGLKDATKTIKVGGPKAKMTATAARTLKSKRSTSLVPSAGDDAIIANAKLIASQVLQIVVLGTNTLDWRKSIYSARPASEATRLEALEPEGGNPTLKSVRGSQDLGMTQRARTRTSSIAIEQGQEKAAGWLYGADK